MTTPYDQGCDDKYHRRRYHPSMIVNGEWTDNLTPEQAEEYRIGWNDQYDVKDQQEEAK